MKAIERGLNQASNAYNNAMTKLSGRGSALSQAENMKKLGAKTGKTIALALNDNEFAFTAPAEAVTAANTSACSRYSRHTGHNRSNRNISNSRSNRHIGNKRSNRNTGSKRRN